MNELEINSFLDFIQSTDQFGFYGELVLFRGQAVKGNLLPGVARDEPRRNTVRIERHILEQLRLQGASFLATAGESLLDSLVTAQHYGMKTRLLDWTTNPLVALWFACSDWQSGDAYVYALEANDLLVKDIYAKSPFVQTKTRVFQPRLNNERIIAQDGWFTLHKYSTKSEKFVPLEHNVDAKHLLRAFRIPKKSRIGILDSLQRHGVTARTVYPGLHGLCLSLNEKYKNRLLDHS
ncbi:FRG domain-containing protein [Xanthomonas arboricola]|uniref:FRG domain-containing protein n=1 Tax=Xanthomonas arboricola TaxID=56448 RepID=UPI0015E3F867|nr:FRG domain-containing protein [Xanthomonas arboricola]